MAAAQLRSTHSNVFIGLQSNVSVLHTNCSRQLLRSDSTWGHFLPVHSMCELRRQRCNTEIKSNRFRHTRTNVSSASVDVHKLIFRCLSSMRVEPFRIIQWHTVLRCCGTKLSFQARKLHVAVQDNPHQLLALQSGCDTGIEIMLLCSGGE
eukprot:PhF_6_TR24825/c1_g1_i1/m.34209